MLLANASTPYDLLTLDPVRPGLTAKGSFKNSKSEGIFISITHVKTSLENV